MPLIRKSYTSSQLKHNVFPRAMKWGVAAGTIGLFVIEAIPRVKKDLFYQLPLVGSHWSEYKDFDI